MKRRSSRKSAAGQVERQIRRGDSPEAVLDTVAIEEPLEIRVAEEALAVTMRTPGADPALAVGFLFAEGVISGLADVGTVRHCGDPTEVGYGNVIDVSPGPGVVLDPEHLATSRRGTLTTAACGVCGRRSIDDLLARCVPLSGDAVPVGRLLAAVSALAEGQALFEATGTVHGAAAFDEDGEQLAHAEDIGRHNAVDKVIGRLLYDGARERARVLAVSGRVSFEIVQKAVVAGIAAVAGVSGPTSLAVDLAKRSGLTLAGFVRPPRYNLY